MLRPTKNIHLVKLSLQVVGRGVGMEIQDEEGHTRFFEIWFSAMKEN